MALVYFLVGVSWIIVSDFLVLGLVTDSQAITYIQTAKGWVFVAGSTIIIYWLTAVGTNRLRETNDRLDRALRQTSILHRLLRHNLRNNCNIIRGNAEVLEETASPAEAERLSIIKEQTDEVAALSEKTQFLRDAVMSGRTQERDSSLTEVVTAAVDLAETRYPNASIETVVEPDLDDATTSRLKRAILELIENAVEHDTSPSPEVRVGARSTPDGTAEVTVQDWGPGMPQMERDVLERGHETPMFHSQGLGLWIARTIVDSAGGDVRIVDNKPTGTVVTIRLP